MRECMEEVKLLLKTKMPCIWINTYEEEDVISDLKEIAAEMNILKVKSWTFTGGLQQIPLSSKERVPEAEKCDPYKLFAQIQEAQKHTDAKGNAIKNEALWILKDVHLFNSDHKIIRVLRDTKEDRMNIRKSYNPIIFIAPVTSIPLEWEKLVHVINYDVPEREEIRSYVTKAAATLQKGYDAGKGYEVPSENTIDKVVTACIGLTHNEINDVLSKSVIKFKGLSTQAILEEKIQLVQKSGVLDYRVPKIMFDDIGGNKAFKGWVDEVIAGMSDEAVEFGCKRSKGYIAIGIPGTGKTAFAEALANKFGYPLLQLNMSKIMSKLVGDSEKKIDQAFRIVKACAPCLFLIDEVEKALGGK